MTVNIAKINGKEVRYDDAAAGVKRESDMTKKLFLTSMQAVGRLTKLNGEFKAGEAYVLQKSAHTQKEATPNLNDPFVIAFKQKFIKACISTGKACGPVCQGDIDTIIFKSLASSALRDLRDLQTFSLINPSKANALFEEALFDTNIEAAATGILAIFTCGISLLATPATGHKFTDKLAREIDDFSQMSSLVSELEAYIPHE